MRDPSATGVWTVKQDCTPDAKLCACGVRVRKWVSMHGLAINVHTNLDHFNLIVPCGLRDKAVTSIARERGTTLPLDEVMGVMARVFGEVFEADVVDAA